jgi:hypothetical protein
MVAMAKGQKIGGAVAYRPGPGADHVADGVDRPGDVVQDADADEPGPEERGQGPPPGPGEQAASATQVMTGPWKARLPTTASAIRTGRMALNARWVK